MTATIKTDYGLITWDSSTHRWTCNDSEIEELTNGYLANVQPEYSPADGSFLAWIAHKTAAYWDGEIVKLEVPEAPENEEVIH